MQTTWTNQVKIQYQDQKHKFRQTTRTKYLIYSNINNHEKWAIKEIKLHKWSLCR